MWRVARSLDVLLAEINAAAPKRSKASDGSIGDADHASRDSDHNPFVIKDGKGIVRARDFTHDPKGGLDCNALARRLALMLEAGAHPACQSGAYVIWNGRIFSRDRRKEGWRPYTGSSPHDHHLHLSVTTDPTGFDSVRPWGVMTERKRAVRLKCATWNVHQGDDVNTRVGELMTFLDEFDIDVLLVDEFNDYARATRRALRGEYVAGTFWLRGGSARDSAVISRKGLRRGIKRLHRLESKGWERGKGRAGLHWARSMVSQNVAGIRFAPVHQAPGPFGAKFPLRRLANETGFRTLTRLAQRWTRARRPWVAAGDWNRSAADRVSLAFLRATGAAAHGRGIDWIAAKGVRVTDVREHRFGTSDHDPKTFTVTKER